MATLRFGTPAPSAPQQTVLGTRWGDDAAPQPGAWRDTFVYGIGVTHTTLPATWRNLATGANESVMLDTAATKMQAIHHPDSGIKANGFNAVAYWNADSSATGWAEAVESSGKPLVVVQGIEGDVDGEWIALDDATAAASDIDAVLTVPLGRYDDHPSVLAYTFADDLFNDAVHGRRAGELMDRIPELDAAMRPGTPSFLGNTARQAIAASTYDIGLFGGGGYPSRWISTGVKRVEGDFSVNDAPAYDWSDAARDMAIAYPDAHVWWWAQGHQLGTGSTPTLDLSYPTAREIRKQVWELIGAGVKGILWFVYQDDTEFGNWLGLAHPSSRSRMAAVAEMGRRITPNIRARLLRATPVAPLFTATGGGSGGTWAYKNFAAAYCATLYDVRSDTYYVVVCNRSLATASVTIDSATLDGTLVNLETGVSIAVGGAVSLPALDGALFRAVPSSSYGVPDHMLVQADDDAHGADSWWAQHWTNPASTNYLAPGTIDTHPNRVLVPDGADLQAAVNAAPDNTTFVLDANGTYCLLDLVARNGIHVVFESPNNPDPALATNLPTLYGLNLLGHERAREYHWNDGWVNAIIGTARDGVWDKPTNDLTAVAAYVNPPRDYLFRYIRFTQEPGTTVDQVYETREGTRELHNPKHAPFYASGVRDTLVELCRFEGYEHSDNNGIQGGTTPLEFTHPGFIYASGGVEGIWFRNNVVDSTPANGGHISFPFAVYFDGPQNCAVVDNTFFGGNSGGFIVTLTNWDVRNDWDHDGNNMELREWRQPRFVMVVGNRISNVSQLFWTNRNARKCLAADNLWTIVGLRHTFLEYEAEDTTDTVLVNAITGFVVRDNDIVGDDVGDSTGAGFVHMKLSGSYTVTSLAITGNSITKPFPGNTVPNGYLTCQLDSGGLPASYTISGNTP